VDRARGEVAGRHGAARPVLWPTIASDTAFAALRRGGAGFSTLLRMVHRALTRRCRTTGKVLRRPPAQSGEGASEPRTLCDEGWLIANAIVVAVPPIGAACCYSPAVQPTAPATVIAVTKIGPAIPTVIAVRAIVPMVLVPVVMAVPAALVGIMPTTATIVALAATAVMSVLTTVTVSTTAVSVLTTVTVSTTTVAMSTATMAVSTATAATDECYKAGRGIAFKDRHGGCLCRP
jgi:hypothetical protein